MLITLQCNNCGSTDLVWQNKILECRHCGTKFILQNDENNSNTSNSSGSNRKNDNESELLESLKMCERLEELGSDSLDFSIKKTQAQDAVKDANAEIETVKKRIKSLKKEQTDGFFFMRTLKTSDIKRDLEAAEATLAELEKKLLVLTEKQKEAELAKEKFSSEFEEYIAEMEEKCKIPPEFWYESEKIRKCMTNGYTDLESVIRYLKKKKKYDY